MLCEGGFAGAWVGVVSFRSRAVALDRLEHPEVGQALGPSALVDLSQLNSEKEGRSTRRLGSKAC